MYESFFGFRERPFPATAHADRYFPSQAAEHARQTITRCIERAEGPSLLIGPAGTGKTLLCQVLAWKLATGYRVALLASGRLCTRRALLQAILFELGLPYRDMEEGELRLSLVDHLQPSPACPNGLLLLVDEAHTLPLRLLEEIRLITNLTHNGQARVRLVLAGNASLEERFSSPKLESFNQRIAARCYLEPLTREETAAYVRSQVSFVGGQGESIFQEDSLRAIFHATDGIPRLINQLGDHALMLAFAGGKHTLNASHIEEAWSDLQQLPTPWQAAKTAESAAPAKRETIIEFGQLEPLSDRPATETFDPTARLEEIEEQVALVAEDFVTTATQFDDDFHPAGRIGPEVELTFPSTRDPFAESFEEEEIVIDRYAALDARVLENRPQVRSEEGRRIASILPEAPKARHQAPSHSQPVAVAASPKPVAVQLRPVHDDVDIVFPPDESLEPLTTPVTTAAELDEEAHDDRDIILIDDDEESFPVNSHKPAGRATRQEYRGLFARLRKN